MSLLEEMAAVIGAALAQSPVASHPVARVASSQAPLATAFSISDQESSQGSQGSQKNSRGLIDSDGYPVAPWVQADILEAIDERAAILEFEAGQARATAEIQAASAMQVYRYRLTDHPDRWLVMIAPGCDLEDARRTLAHRFGPERLIEVVRVERHP